MAVTGGAGGFTGEMRITQPRHELVVTEQEVSIDGELFTLSEVDRVAYWAMPFGPGGYGSYSTEFFLRLGLGNISGRFSIVTQDRFEFPTMETCPRNWREILDHVEMSVCGRIGEELATTIAGGGEVMFGEVCADASGLHRQHRSSTTSVAWDEIIDTNIDDNALGLVTEPTHATSLLALTIPLDEWNVIVLPHVVRLLRRSSGGHLKEGETGRFTSPTLIAVRDAAEAVGELCVPEDLGVMVLPASSLVMGPRGQYLLGVLFGAYEAVVSDVGEDEAFNAAVSAARDGAGPAPVDQDLAERVVRALLRVAPDDSSLRERFNRGMSDRPEDKDERDLQEFFDELAKQQVKGRSGDSEAFDRVKDMFTARTRFREIYGRVVADKGQDAADRATYVNARTVTRIYAEIFGVDDEDGAVQAVDELINSFLTDP